MILSMDIASKLNRLCEQRRLSGADLAALTPGVSRSTVGNWLNGTTRPDLASALRLARGLGMSLEWLADDLDASVPERADALRQRAWLDFGRAIGFEMGLRGEAGEDGDLRLARLHAQFLTIQSGLLVEQLERSARGPVAGEVATDPGPAPKKPRR